MGGGAVIVETLVARCKQIGVELLTETSGQKMLTGTDGKVKGVLTKTEEGELSITAKAVIIATGGYAGNKDLLEKFCPSYFRNMRLLGIPNMGEGILMAYVSSESGAWEVYVRPFSDLDKGGQWQISTGGGTQPRWSRDGRELFFCQGDTLMAVEVETEPSFLPGTPKVLFRESHFLSFVFGWDISPDGNQFLIVKPATMADDKTANHTSPRINVVLNWFEELKQRVPVD